MKNDRYIEEVLHGIEHVLIAKKEEQFDYDWADEFSFWDSSDCSDVGLLCCFIQMIIENQSSGVFGTQDDSKRCVSRLVERICSE